MKMIFQSAHIRLFVLSALVFSLVSCSNQKSNTTINNTDLVEKSLSIENKDVVKCTNPRPEFCTREYRPVCATRDTNVRCVTTPCPSTELKTYSNKCDACSDEKVLSYIPNACD